MTDQGPARTWRPTPALTRALVVATVGLSLAVLVGRPSLVVLVAPVTTYAVFALRARPRQNVAEVRVETQIGHRVLRERQGTRSRLRLTGSVGDVEHVTRVLARSPDLAMRPRSGVLGALVSGEGDQPAVDVPLSPRRWGRTYAGPELVALHSAWAGFRWGPDHREGQAITVLPIAAPFDSRAEAPSPIGLVGAHRSRRDGDGTEFSGIRPFHVGDRLRRINWRVSLRTGDLHVVTTRAEEDSGVLIVVDATVDVQAAQGPVIDRDDAEPSSLDQTVRAAAALAEHHLRLGDRVGLRVVGGREQVVGYGAGQRHLRRILGALALVRPGTPSGLGAHLELPVTAGSVVLVFSPLLHPAVVSAAARLTASGHPTLAVDTLPEHRGLSVGAAGSEWLRQAAWRLRLAERDLVVEALAGTGCPVVRWQGQGSLDAVMHQLARWSSRPKVVVR